MVKKVLLECRWFEKLQLGLGLDDKHANEMKCGQICPKNSDLRGKNGSMWNKQVFLE